MGEGMEKHRKLLLGSMCCIIVIFFILYWRQTSMLGISFEDGFLLQEDNGDIKSYKGRCYSLPTIITVKGLYEEHNDMNITIAIGNKVHKSYLINLGDETYNDMNVKILEYNNTVFEGKYISDGLLFKLKDGLYSSEEATYVTYEGTPRWNNLGMNYNQIMYIISGKAITHKGDWRIYLLVTFIGFIYIIDIIFPTLFFKIKYSFSVMDPEPSEWYIFVQKVSWYVLPFVFLSVYLKGLFLLGI